MVEKKEGATMECKNCETELICRKKDYGGDYKAVLQWQNFDGKAHYTTKDGKDFTCNIPDEEETAQTRIPTDSEKTPQNTAPKQMSAVELALLTNINQKIDSVLADLERLKDMVTPLFQKMVDDQIGRTL
jgi:hypothetical protein